MPRLQFNIRFRTQYGQQLLIIGNSPALGQLKQENAIPMCFLDQETWQLEVDVPFRGKNTPLHYKYLLKNQDGSFCAEWGNDRVIGLTSSFQTYVLFDTWNHAGDYENAFFTTPFQEVLLLKHKKFSKKTGTGSYIFRVKAPLLQPYQQVCLLGNTQRLHSWSTEQPLLLQKRKNWWEIALELEEELFPISYKYGIWDVEQKQFVQYEEGDNRVLPASLKQSSSCICMHDGFIKLPNNSWRGAGVSIPVFCLRTKQSFGIGEFTDIKKLADWSQAAGLRLIQLLPINDTIASQTWQDSYPYAAISAFALHPIYINLALVAGTKHAVLLRPLRKVQEQLNNKKAIDYEAVIRIKLETLRKLYEVQGSATLEAPDFLSFFQQNKHWLKPYAAFCYYRDQFGTTQFVNWPNASTYDAADTDQLFKSIATRKKVNFYAYVQFHLDLQLKEAVAYTHKKGLVLKGDIPIGIYRYGVDAWVDPTLYNMDWQAGAPPDDFTSIGQNWGFQTYNWKKMQQDGFAWWKQRFEQMSYYFDTFRIDHMLGFFRIWGIPTSAVQGVLSRFVPCLPITREELQQQGITVDLTGFCKPYINDDVLSQLPTEVKDKLFASYHDYFYRRQDHFGYPEAVQKLPFLKEATNRLICGEDLGMVPYCVPDVMNQTGILCLEIRRMPKDPSQSYFNLVQAPYLSVVTPSIHDMSTIRGWWEEDRTRTQQFYNQVMEQWGEAPQYCEAWINRAIVVQHLKSPAMWSIFQLQDLLGMSEAVRSKDPQEERINDPANPKHYWQYRLHMNLEDLIKDDVFTSLVRQTIANAGRIK